MYHAIADSSLHIGLTQADIQHRLFKEEADLVDSGVLSLHEVSPCSFIIAGLELEEQQYVTHLTC
jgi:hypothetical protein